MSHLSLIQGQATFSPSRFVPGLEAFDFTLCQKGFAVPGALRGAMSDGEGATFFVQGVYATCTCARVFMRMRIFLS